MSACPRCPCPDDCRRLPAYCGWAAEEPPDPIKIRHIRDASAHRRAGYPPLATRAAGLAASFWHWAVSGFSTVSDAEKARRLAICEGCGHFTGSRQCDLCTCYMDLKTRLATAHCPIALW